MKRNGGVKITRKVIKDNGAYNKVYKLISVKILRKNFSVKNKKLHITTIFIYFFMFNVYQQVESETAHRVTVYNLQKSAILQVPA